MVFDLIGNIYFVVGLVLCLMISDYLLTLLGQKYYKKYLKNRLVTKSYELNPFWQKSIEKERYDYRHILLVLLLCNQG